MRNVVLLVEDELFVAIDIQETIEKAGLDVRGPYVSVEETLAAIQEFGEVRPICAILDVRLEDGEVYPAADQIRDAGIPIIFHSGHADGRELELRYPDARFCSKPCSPSILREKVLELAKAG